MTLFEKFDNTVDGELIRKLSELSDYRLGNSEEAVKATFYTLMAGLIRRANSDMSTGLLLNQVKKIAGRDMGKIDLSAALKNKTDIQKLVEIGDNNMSQIFPSLKSQLINLVTTYSGTSKEQAANYIGFLNALIIRFLSEEIDNGMDKDDLMNYLKSHRDPLFEIAPENLVEKMIPAMGMHELRSMKLTYAKKQEEKVTAKREERKKDTVLVESYPEGLDTSKINAPKILAIIAIVAALGSIAYFVFFSENNLFSKKDSKATEVVISDLPEMLPENTLTTDSLEADANPDVSALTEILKAEQLNPNLEIRLEALKFGGDSTELTTTSFPVVDTLLAVFKRNPRFQIQVKGAYSKGDSQIAVKRAFYLKRVLQSKGVDPIRIDAVADTEAVDYLKIRVVSK
jgi:hypothetical protein